MNLRFPVGTISQSSPSSATSKPSQAESAASRNCGPGSVTIAGHFSQAVHRQLRLLGAAQGRTLQSLLDEALNELFRKHERRPIAGE